MTRIIAGSARGRRLQVPPGRDTRPTSDRVREALFSRLEHEGVLDDAHVLDLYAGSGALGLEALSRGARSALLVESDRGTAALVRRNLGATGLDGASVLAVPVARALARPSGQAVDLVLADPPYPLEEPALAEVLALLVDNGWLAQGAVVVVERSTRSPEPTWPDGLTRVDERTYGETRLWFADAD
ncbi:16S rRNA (guanine(966)-N(2))-methyltransferase RsmD [Angustibacter sp. McL0619]|uniref:16S rRNA (guanine(966)-N(2))-methyltransferase RsmD n=1 Tax=Angustibacter sp. McL0619 TaxID=3415676 RepID=UPI003CEEE231